MKKRLCAIVLLAALLAGLAACGKGSGQRLTLMIYMIGSDLESKSGAASDDLDEIKASGVDLDAVNVLVCAGGCEKWQSDAASADKNTVLQLTDKGFETLESWDAVSMGDSTTLTKFLDYGVKNAPAEQYALILWDHGSGPVMGYGVDTLHEKDTLTLPEMRAALEASPFGKDDKLAWVGFDACLMASAELACIWADYADYLVASQEVEPAFGWQYSFLKDAGKVETKKLLDSLTKTYLTACENYYDEKGYSDRDTTLSCMDLSKAAAVADAIDALFAKAAADVDSQYNRLANRRVNTRALGRATTGSEYDLVDLNDAAAQLSALYPDEAKALQEAVSAMVVSNATNADGLSGVSLYYPFFNKYYYENQWADAYDELDLFPAYRDYLAGYDATWLGEHAAADAAGVPTLTAPGEYTLQLTDEQAERFASAEFHVLKHLAEDVYLPIFSSPQVTFNERDKTLTAQFDGRVLYVVNDLDEYFIPAATALSDDNGLLHYAVKCNLENDSPQNTFDRSASENEASEEFRITLGWFHLAVDPEDGSIALSSLLERSEDETGDKAALRQGKAEELDLEGWAYYYFLYNPPHILTRNDENAIPPLSEWNTTDVFTMFEFPFSDGLRFEYAPLAFGSYALLFEITDTQGGRSCSEPGAIDSASTPFREDTPAEPTEIDWQSGDAVTLLERDGLKLRMINMIDESDHPIQTLELTNNTSEPVKLDTSQGPFMNENIGRGGGVSIRAEPGETSTTTSTIYDDERMQMYFGGGTAAYYGYLDHVDSMLFSVRVQTLTTHETIWKNETFLVRYSDETAPPLRAMSDRFPDETESIPEHFRYPCLGAHAEEQVLYSDDAIEVRLLYLGADEDGHPNGVCRVTNRSDHAVYLSTDGVVYNDVFVTGNLISGAFLPHTVQYIGLSDWVPDAWDLEDYQIEGIQSMKLALRISDSLDTIEFGFGTVVWCPVRLSQRADQTGTFPTGERVLCDENGLRITLLGFEKTEYSSGSTYEWTLAVENNTDADIQFAMTELRKNGGSANNQFVHQQAWLCFNTCVGAHQRTLTIVYTSVDEIKTLSFRLAVKTFTGDRILYTTKDVITLEKQ